MYGILHFFVRRMLLFVISHAMAPNIIHWVILKKSPTKCSQKMGGPCCIRIGKSVLLGPPCTDNFQVIIFRYPVNSSEEWHSVEQCFQAQKFLDGGYRKSIQGSLPKLDESDASYGNYVWSLGQRNLPIRPDWEEVKVELMFKIVCAKYAANPHLQAELLSTGDSQLVGQRSTWEWSKWNGLIQTYVRSQIRDHQDLEALSLGWTNRSDLEPAAA
jgi:predicted NAD-dependent protein-ADP-ribosyltransferase YbiA (DUF1768 family)